MTPCVHQEYTLPQIEKPNSKTIHNSTKELTAKMVSTEFCSGSEHQKDNVLSNVFFKQEIDPSSLSKALRFLSFQIIQQTPSGATSQKMFLLLRLYKDQHRKSYLIDLCITHDILNRQNSSMVISF